MKTPLKSPRKATWHWCNVKKERFYLLIPYLESVERWNNYCYLFGKQGLILLGNFICHCATVKCNCQHNVGWKGEKIFLSDWLYLSFSKEQWQRKDCSILRLWQNTEQRMMSGVRKVVVVKYSNDKKETEQFFQSFMLLSKMINKLMIIIRFVLQ